MLPKRITRGWPKSVRKLEVITPDGRVFHFPRPSLLERLLLLLRQHAETAAISTAILVLIYVAGLAAQALGASAFDACDLPRPTRTS